MIHYLQQLAADDDTTSGSVEFYSGVSQIIPVLLLAYLFQLRYASRKLVPVLLTRALSLVNLALALNAEAISLFATFNHAEVGDWAADWTWAGMASLFLAFTYLLVMRIIFPSNDQVAEG